jgi:hypothetical protein
LLRMSQKYKKRTFEESSCDEPSSKIQENQGFRRRFIAEKTDDIYPLKTFESAAFLLPVNNESEKDP